MFAAILLPSFHLQAALRFEPELHRQPVALLAGAGPAGAIVLETTAVARAAEVQAGFTASQALARCPTLQLRRRLPQQEQAAAEALRQTAWAFSPWLEPTAPGLCTLDLRGRAETNHRAWALTLMQRLATRQLFARVGVAEIPISRASPPAGPGRFCSWPTPRPSSPRCRWRNSSRIPPWK